jgi:hypothetical protein
VRDGGFNLENGATCSFVKHAVKGYPMLAPLADNGGPTKTMALKRQSPAINRVSAKNDACRGTTDQRRVPRPQGGSCDIGAFEVVATRTRLRVKRVSKRGNRIRLSAKVHPRFPIPGQPRGRVVFRNGGRFLGARRLDGDRPDTASIKTRVSGGKWKLTASYKGSKLFLPSSS